ncbi:hypothetical protein LBMAG46_40440 [Planctomycetia bacterium]|nr:hypothetical protein LBMAG46_40440 [Planctomycetia bacterium]
MQTATEDGVCHHRCQQQQIGQPWKHGSSSGAEGLTGRYKLSSLYRQEMAGGRKFSQKILIGSVFDGRDFELKRGFAAKPSSFWSHFLCDMQLISAGTAKVMFGELADPMEAGS